MFDEYTAQAADLHMESIDIGGTVMYPDQTAEGVTIRFTVRDKRSGREVADPVELTLGDYESGNRAVLIGQLAHDTT